MITVDIRIERPGKDHNRYQWDSNLQAIRYAGRQVVDQPADVDEGVLIDALGVGGHPLRAWILTHQSFSPMAVVATRAIGLLQIGEGKQEELLIVGVPDADPAWRYLQSHEDLPPHRRQALREYAARLAGPGSHVRWGDPSEAASLIEAGQRASRWSRVGQHSGQAERPAWQTMRGAREGDELREAGGGHTLAEILVPQLPYRFQEYVARCLLSDERILHFIHRRPMSGSRWAWRRRRMHPEGMLIVTDQQTLWLWDVLPPTPTIVGYGYVAKSCPHNRLLGVEVLESAGGSQLELVMRPARQGEERVQIEFAEDARPSLRLVEAFLRSFVPGEDEEQHLLRLFEPEEDETTFAELIEEHDDKTRRLVARLEEVGAEILDSRPVLARSLVPAWAEEKGRAAMLAVMDDEVVIIRGGEGKQKEVEIVRCSLADATSASLCFSVMGSWMRIDVPDDKPVEIAFPLIAVRNFTAAFLAIRQRLASMAG